MIKILGLDIGISSIGWALVSYDNIEPSNSSITKTGVRIFTQAENPKNGKSLALPRREARGARRMIKRKRVRIRAVKYLFIKYLNISNDKIFSEENIYTQSKQKDVWQLRDKGLKRILSAEELARVLTQIAKRRGYKSNRKSSDANDKDIEKKQVLNAITQNTDLRGYETIGQAIYQRTKDTKIRRNRHKMDDDKKDNQIYLNSVSREMLENEIKTIFKYQRDFGNVLASEEFEREYLRQAFSQNPFASIDDMVGYCTFETDEKRAPKRSYSAEEFVALSKLINTKLILADTNERRFTSDELPKLMDLCRDKEKPAYADLRKAIALDEEIKFKALDYYDKNTGEVSNPEKDKFKNEFNGYHTLRKITEKTLSSIHWHNISVDRNLLDKIAEIFSYHKDEILIREELEKLAFTPLTKDEKAKLIEAFLANVQFDKFNDLSVKAITKLLPFMYKGMRYDEAVKEAYPNGKSFEKSVLLRALSEQENNVLTNPVVKRAFSQARKVVNAIIKRYGTLDSIHIEFARELKKSFKDRKDMEKSMESYRVNKEQVVKEFIEHFGEEPRGEELQKFILAKEQNWLCIYSEKHLEIERIREIGYVEIDHILPFSRSLDNSKINKALCLSDENRKKGNKTPYEYFQEVGRDWERHKIFLGMLKHIKSAKKQRLLKQNFDENSEQEFRKRNLNDTAFIAKFVKNFIEDTLIFNHNNSKRHVEVVNGSLTSFLRHEWGLDKKNRDNHLHHAQDAVIIAFATQSVTQKLATISAKNYKFSTKSADEKSGKVKFAPPLENFRTTLETSISDVFVSFAPRKKVTGAAHKETAYSPKTLMSNKKKEKPDKLTGGSAVNNIKTKSGIFVYDVMPRVDIFRHKTSKKYYIVPIYVGDFIKDTLPNKAIVQGKLPDGTPKPWLEMDENYEFCFSLFKDELVEVQTKKEKIFGYFVGADSSTGGIEIKSHDNKTNDIFKIEPKKKLATKSCGIQNAISITKYQVDALGYIRKVKQEKRLGTKKGG